MSDILEDLKDEMTNLDNMTREQLIGQIMYLRSKLAWLEEAVSDRRVLDPRRVPE